MAHFKRHKPKKYLYSMCGFFSCADESASTHTDNGPKRYPVSYWKRIGGKTISRYKNKDIGEEDGLEISS
jgi:hypothetical protein